MCILAILSFGLAQDLPFSEEAIDNLRTNVAAVFGKTPEAQAVTTQRLYPRNSADSVEQSLEKLNAEEEQLLKDSDSLPGFEPNRVNSIETLNTQQDALARELGRLQQQGAKDQENIKVLADYIVKLRKELAEKSGKTPIYSLKSDPSNNSEEKKTLELGIVSLRTKLRELEQERTKLEEQKLNLNTSLAAAQEELEQTKRYLSKTTEEVKSCDLSLQQSKKEIELSSKELDKLAELESGLKGKEAEIVSLQARLKDAEELNSNIPALKRELLAAKNLLLMKERELNLVSTIGENGPKVSPKRNGALSHSEQDKLLESSGIRAGQESIRGRKQVVETDVVVVEVQEPRVALRSGPSQEDSELMPVARGTRLTVEDRSGEWYRVIAPNSTRAYIRADMVQIVSGNETRLPYEESRRAPSKAPLKIGQDSEMEAFGKTSAVSKAQGGDSVDRAFQRLMDGLGRK